MKKKRRKRIPAAILAAALTLMIGTATVFAAWKYLMPSEVAEHVGDLKLAEAFEGDEAVLVNETQEFQDYRITLLGAVSGKNISQYLSTDNAGNLKEDMFYATVAIERTDGKPMPDTNSEDYEKAPFYASPYIKGLDPSVYSIMSMGGGYSEFVQDGIQYRLLEMENIEIFADQGIYIGVCEGTFYDSSAYRYDEEKKEMSRNEAYEGVNALFVLPLDETKGNPKAAEKYLEELQRSWETQPEGEAAVDLWDTEADAFMAQLTPDIIEEYCKPIESTRQILTPDKEGMIHSSWELSDGAGGSASYSIKELFPDGKAGMNTGGFSYSYSEGLEDLLIETYTLNEDGTVSFVLYTPKL